MQEETSFPTSTHYTVTSLKLKSCGGDRSDPNGLQNCRGKIPDVRKIFQGLIHLPGCLLEDHRRMARGAA